KLNKKSAKPVKPEIDEEDVQRQIKETLARLTTPKQKSKTSKHRREKRELFSQKRQDEFDKLEAEKNILKVTEFVSVNEMSAMMNVPVTNLIATCMSLGLFVSINQRLDAETMALVADEYGFQVEFVSAEVLNEIEEIVDEPEDLMPRPPIVTVMGHVDHGKTKLLDRIRNTNVVDGEAGGITQHIGAYSVTLGDGRQITFLDTPGHEAFTAMRARGAQITDVAIIIIAADDNIMPQTVEAINHASAAGVPIVFAINKIDKPTANPEKIRESLAAMNYLVEDWGGKYQCQEISAKAGINIEELLEKVVLEAEILELKANPNKNAVGTVIESSLDKGRGYVATLIVQSGTMKVGDVLLAGCQTGRVKAMYNERGQKVDKAGPATPVLVLGLNGAPQAGDKFNVMDSDSDAHNLANKRMQLQREQGLRTQKHITLDEIGRRLALGNFNEINIIVKGDVDGSVEALSDSLIKLSTENFAVNIIHKAVGQISESDVMLAAASNAIIVGFQVRPSSYARKLAEKEEIEIRLYSIIYDAINEIKDAMEGMLSPTVKETITGSCEIREVFKITKVGTIAGCLVTDGKIYKKSKVRVIRDGIVIYTGELGSLKRFKDEVKEVGSGLECGLNIDRFNDIKVGDIVEAFDETEVKQKL
ncbi:MAG: translation initiation factor IF-2, partial [Bacteroidales bacterium]|nr:translation initiation factor IF-2 [Bacteroidales bacterium]